MARNVKGQAKVEKKNKVLKELNVEYINPKDIKPNDYNPNRQSEHDFNLLLKSMEEDGFTQPIVVQKSTRQIVDGEHRWRAAQHLGHAKIPVVFVDMTKEQMRIATLRHNRARGSEDIELSAQVLRDLQELGALDWAQDSLQLSDIEMNKLIEDVSAPDALADEEYSAGWVPDDIDDPAAEAENTQQTVKDDGQGNTMSTAMSAKAVEAQRHREKAIAEAKTEEEKQMARKESALYRLYLTFAGDQADLVKGVLGESPAETVVNLCEKFVAGEQRP
jgi:ParB/RepB/Spo0J family partition protein